MILGRAGTGKTRVCLEGIRAELRRSAEGPPLIFLVPEQATFQAELALAKTPGLGGMMRAQVLSFRRLAWRVLQEVGGAARVHIGELGKRMVLRQLLEQRRAELRVFHRAAEQPGFADTLASALGEFKFYRVTPQRLQSSIPALRQQGQGLLADKLHDLALLYHDLEAYLAGRYVDPDDYLNLLAERLYLSPTMRGAEVWVDGFAGFTPQEYGVLEQILRATRRVHVALCLDSRALAQPLDELDLFHPTRETYEKLRDLAAAAGVDVEPPLCLDAPQDAAPPHRFAAAPELAHLERHFFQRPAPALQTDGQPPRSVKLVAAANRRAEVEGAAREIVRLCRDRGYRWREIAVVLRDVSAYHELIATVFADYGIPFFLDQKRPVLHHPLVELIRSALQVLAEGWTYDPLFRYLKTDLVPIGRHRVDQLENYVLAHGIRGSRWTDGKPWTYRRRYTLGETRELSAAEEKELEWINQARQQAVEPLLELQRAIEAAPAVRGVTAALYGLLERLRVPDQLEHWSKQAEAAGRLDEAREHAQVWGGVVGLLDQMVESLGDLELPLATYLQVLESGLESLRLGLIPPGLDQVLIGSLERSRNPNVKAALVLGVSDGVLPARHSDEGMFSDVERERLHLAGVELAPGGRRRLFDEQFLVYIALTRASETLWISYPLADEEGRAIMPSAVVARLRELLPDLRETPCGVEPPGQANADLEYICRPGRTLSYLAAQLRQARAGRAVSPVWWSAYNWMVSRPDWREECRRVVAGLFHRNQESPIPRDLGVALYGQPLRASVSRLERFRACSFAHFASHGLRLKERTLFQLGAPDLGEFFHAALKLFAERLQAEGIDWGALDRAQAARISGEVVDALAPELQHEILLSTARHRYLTGKLRRTVQRAVDVLTEHARRGRFRPVGLELGFGPDAELPPVVLSLAQGGRMELIGRIDRVDLARADDAAYLRIIDYKSGSMGLSLTDIYYGLQLQLLTYLDVVLTHAAALLQGKTGLAGGQAPAEGAAQPGGNALPGGILYFTVQNPLIRQDKPSPPDQVEREILKKLRMKGLVLADTRLVRLMDREAEQGAPLIPVTVKKDGSLGSRSKVATPAQFDLLRQRLRQTLRQTGQDIVDGVVQINPYRKGNFVSCQYCAFQPVCQFDLWNEDNRYRVLQEESSDAVWTKIASGKGEAAVGQGDLDG